MSEEPALREPFKQGSMQAVTGAHARISVSLPVGYSQETVDQTARFCEVATEAVLLFAAKQEAYGRGNIAQFGERGVVVRSFDKLSRLANLLFHGRVNDEVSKESVEDTFMDQGIYGFIGVMCHRNRW